MKKSRFSEEEIIGLLKQADIKQVQADSDAHVAPF